MILCHVILTHWNASIASVEFGLQPMEFGYSMKCEYCYIYSFFITSNITSLPLIQLVGNAVIWLGCTYSCSKTYRWNPTSRLRLVGLCPTTYYQPYRKFQNLALHAHHPPTLKFWCCFMPSLLLVWGPDLFSEGGGGREKEVWRILQHFCVLLEKK